MSSYSRFSPYAQIFVRLAVPLLLLDADLRKCFKSTGTLLKAFLIGSMGTFIGTITAYALGDFLRILERTSLTCQA